MNFPIEISVYGASAEQIDHWLRSLVGPMSAVTDVPPVCRLYECAGGTVLMLGPMAADCTWISLSFDWLGPWTTPLDCAVQAAMELGRPVGCDLTQRYVEARPFSKGRVQVVTLLRDEDYVGPLVEYV